MSKTEIKIIFQQPAFPKYRMAFFKLLSEQSDIDLKLYYGKVYSLPNVSTKEINATYVPIHTLRIKGKDVLIYHKAQTCFINKKSCDIICLSWNSRFVSLVPALLKAKIKGIPSILWGHGYSKKETKLGKLIRNHIAKLSTALVFYDYHTSENFIKLGWNTKRIFTAPNSLDQSLISKAKEKWLEIPEKLYLFRKEKQLLDSKCIIYTGRIFKENRLDVLFKALAIIKINYPNIKLIIIGTGDSEIENLMSLSKMLNIENNIIWCGAIYKEDQIAPWMLSSEIFCYPSNIGLSCFHAMGYSLPVVTSDNASLHGPEFYSIKDGINGKLFSYNSHLNLAKVVNELLESENLNVMKINALKTVEKKYNINKMVKGFMQAIKYSHREY